MYACMFECMFVHKKGCTYVFKNPNVIVLRAPNKTELDRRKKLGGTKSPVEGM